MSTNKTQNYQLHSWTPEDDFRLHEVNENFTALDTALGSEAAARTQQIAAKAEIVSGVYIGGGQYGHHIDLPRAPQSVHIETPSGCRSTNLTNGGLFTEGSGGIVALDATGFSINDKSQLNYPGSRYAFMAVLAAE